HTHKPPPADNPSAHRPRALALLPPQPSLEAMIGELDTPTVVATSARADSFPGAVRRTTDQLLAEATLTPAPLLIVLGTGWGLADALIPSVSRVLAPIEGDSQWNHLS